MIVNRLDSSAMDDNELILFLAEYLNEHSLPRKILDTSFNQVYFLGGRPLFLNDSEMYMLCNNGIKKETWYLDDDEKAEYEIVPVEHEFNIHGKNQDQIATELVEYENSCLMKLCSFAEILVCSIRGEMDLSSKVRNIFQQDQTFAVGILNQDLLKEWEDEKSGTCNYWVSRLLGNSSIDHDRMILFSEPGECGVYIRPFVDHIKMNGDKLTLKFFMAIWPDESIRNVRFIEYDRK